MSKTSGIYKITNLINYKVYIGQSWDIEKRWKQHQRSKAKTHLNEALSFYGIKNFSFTIVKVLDEFIDQRVMDQYEKIFIEVYGSMDRSRGYNKRSGGSNGLLSEETKSKLSKALKGKPKSEAHIQSMVRVRSTKEYKDSLSASKRGIPGKPQTEETKNKIRNTLKGRVFSQETRDKISASLTGKHFTEKQKEARAKRNTDEFRQKQREGAILSWQKRKNRIDS